ncbi:hypothetical protein RSPO_c00474 [Ralstonia solanacearum Po82]|uniref:Uncharacterized protein n=1 Tax=Ralstonia solanacearum (strain Po82) TaxID=1031711 RepID=F6FXP2_RALS8|nr:hypothetical protein RSPO_c00474 [Ralstonia solanacearum Po82]
MRTASVLRPPTSLSCNNLSRVTTYSTVPVRSKNAPLYRLLVTRP